MTAVAIAALLLALGTGPLRGMTIDEYLALLYRNHPLVRQERLGAEIARRQHDAAGASRDWTLGADASYAHTQPVPTTPFSPGRVDVSQLNASIGKLFWDTGGTLSAGWNTTLTEQDLPAIVFPVGSEIVSIPTGLTRVFEHSVSLNYSQPLLRSRDTPGRTAWRSAGFAARAAADRAAENIEDFLVRSGSRFIDWALLAEQTGIARERLELAQTQLSLVKEKRALNLVDRVDVLRAEDAVHAARQALSLAEARLAAVRRELAVLAGCELAGEAPDYPLFQTEPVPSPEEAYEDIRHSSRALRTLRAQQAQLSLAAVTARAAALPGLDLNVGGGLLGGNDLFDASLRLDRPFYSAALAFTYPFGNRAREAGYAAAQERLAQAGYALENAERGLQSTLANLLIQLDTMRQVLELNREQVRIARERTAAELELYRQGRGDLTFVIQSADSAQNARLVYARNAADYRKMLLEYRGLADALLPDDAGAGGTQ